MRLGDTIEEALSIVGITSARVEAWVGGPCGCPERIAKLNQLSAWASRVIRGRIELAAEYLNRIMEREE